MQGDSVNRYRCAGSGFFQRAGDTSANADIRASYFAGGTPRLFPRLPA